MPQAAPQVCRIRPIPPPKEADMRNASASSSMPYKSAQAAKTDWLQLKPCLKRSFAFWIRCSISCCVIRLADKIGS